MVIGASSPIAHVDVLRAPSSRRGTRPNRGSLIGLRAALRADGDYDLADPVRGALVAADIELRDQPATTFWQLRNTHHER
jgi:cysteinyl-tRNA synthetase